MQFPFKKILTISLIIFMLTGCLYPQSERKENQIPHEDQIASVQQAIDKFHEENQGRLPIETKESDVPIFEKYIIEFDKLINDGYLSSIPGNAFENGGFFKYALIDVEENPTVKLIDLRMSEKIRSINTRLEIYRSKNTYPPFGEKIAKNIFHIDYEKIDLDSEPTVDSPYSENKLPLIMDNNGNVYVDYRKDLFEFLKTKDHSYVKGDDIRYLLVDETFVLPAFSLPYTLDDKNEPVFKVENNS